MMIWLFSRQSCKDSNMSWDSNNSSYSTSNYSSNSANNK